MYSIGNYIQFPIISYNPKECEKYICVYTYTYIYIYIKLNHFALYQKLTQYCKSAIFQFKNSHNL